LDIQKGKEIISSSKAKTLKTGIIPVFIFYLILAKKYQLPATFRTKSLTYYFKYAILFL